MRAVIYSRFSTEKQRDESIEDQNRLCERLAEGHGFQVVAHFSDKAISAGTAQRPGYQDLLRAARRHEFDVIVAEDTSRLWRNMAEQAPRLAELSDLGIAVVTHDLDTRQESAEILGAVTGAMSAQYRREIGRRTRRGLEGRARAGKSAGGRAYGYLPPALSGTGRTEVVPEQAEIVRWIFERYATGWSPLRIAADLNARGVPSPGCELEPLEPAESEVGHERDRRRQAEVYRHPEQRRLPRRDDLEPHAVGALRGRFEAASDDPEPA